MKSFNVVIAVVVALLLMTGAAAAANHTISVKVTGLTGTLVMQDNKLDTLTFTTNSTQTFAKSYANGCDLYGSCKDAAFRTNLQVEQQRHWNHHCEHYCHGDMHHKLHNRQDQRESHRPYFGNARDEGRQGRYLDIHEQQDPDLRNRLCERFDVLGYRADAACRLTCTLSSNASGTITANITVTATCAPAGGNFTISVATTGLTSGSLVVQDSKSDSLTFTTNNTQTFATSYASGSTYSVTVVTQPAGLTCTLSSNSSGTISSNVTVTATCAKTGTGLTVSVAVTGLSGTVVMQNDLGDSLTFTSNKTQTFASTYATGCCLQGLCDESAIGTILHSNLLHRHHHFKRHDLRRMRNRIDAATGNREWGFEHRLLRVDQERRLPADDGVVSGRSKRHGLCEDQHADRCFASTVPLDRHRWQRAVREHFHLWQHCRSKCA